MNKKQAEYFRTVSNDNLMTDKRQELYEEFIQPRIMVEAKGGKYCAKFTNKDECFYLEHELKDYIAALGFRLSISIVECTISW